MPPGREGGGEHGHGEQANAHGDGGRDEEDPSSSSPPPPPLLHGLAVVSVESEDENKKKQKHEQAEASFPDDILIEILSRVPYRSLCRFKCVSKPWLALCSDRAVHKRSPQTLSGFFHSSLGCSFHNLSGKGAPMVDPDLPFLRSTYTYFRVLQCSTSLLLCKCWKSPHPMQRGWNSFPEGGTAQWFSWSNVDQFDYVVCNPATQEWTSLPRIELGNRSRFSRVQYSLGFDPAVPSCFFVFVPLVSNYGWPTTMIYSSVTRGWTSMQVQSEDIRKCWFDDSECTFLNGIMHFSTALSIVTVDMEGNAWSRIKMPPAVTNNYDEPSIGKSQGRLYAWCIDNKNDRQLSVCVLENYDSEQWTLKCTVNCLELFGRDRCKEDECYRMFAIHPECDSIFLTDSKEKVLTYDMNNQEVHVISTSGDFLEGLPYIPCFAEWKSDGH